MEEEETLPVPGAADGPTRKRSGWRKAVIQIAALVLVVMAVGLATLNSPIGHRFVADRIAALAPASGLRISIGRIEGSLYGQAVLRDVTLSDPKGEFLTVPVVELDWRPFHWFFSGLDVRRLVARRGTLLRIPDLEPGDPDAPILPEFDIRIDKFHLKDLTVAEEVLGSRRRVDLVMRANKRPGRAYLRVDGDMGGADRLHALLDSDPDRNRFDLDVDYRAPAGGLLAQLVGAEDDMRLRIVGDGKWTNWKGAFVAWQGRKRLAAFRLTNRSGRYGLLGQLDPAPLMGNALPGMLGRKVSLGANATLENSVVDGRAWLVGRAVDFDAIGKLDLDAKRADGILLRVSLTRPDAFGSDVKLTGARLNARLDGKFRSLAIPHDLRVDRIDAGVRIADLRQRGVIRHENGRWTFPLDLSVTRLETGNTTVDPMLAESRMTGQLLLENNRLSGDLQAFFHGLDARLALSGDTARGGYAVAGSVNASGVQLEDLGRLEGKAKILAKLASGAGWSIRADLAGRMPRVADSTLASVTGGNIRFRGGVALASDRPVLFHDVAIDADKLTLRLDGKVVGADTNVFGSGRHADYGPFTVDATMAEDGPHAELVFASPLPAAGLKDVRVALAPIADGFRIDTAGESMLGPFNGALSLITPSAGPTRLEIAQMNVSQTAVSGTLLLGDGGASGKLALGGGGINGMLGLAPRTGGQGFNVLIDAKNARFSGARPTLIRTAHVEASGVLGGDVAQAQGSLYAQGISRGDLFVGRVAAKAAITNGSGSFNASLAGRRGSRFSLQLQGNMAPERLSLLAQGEFAGSTISMPRRAILTRMNEGWRLEPTQLSYGQGHIIGDGRFGGGGPTDLTLKFADMPLSLFDVVLVDLSLGGKVSGTVEFHDAPDAPATGNARLAVKQLTRSGLVLTSRPVDLFLVADLSPDALQMRAAIHESGQRRGRLQARVGNLPRFGGLMERLSSGTLAAQVRYAGSAAALWRLAAIDGFDLTGPVNVAADFGGTIADPSVRGSLASESLRFRSSITGTDIRNISARGTFIGSRLRLTRFAGSAHGGGTVSGSGMIDISGLDQHGPQLDIRLAADDAWVLNRKDMSASVTGPLRIVSDGHGGTIAGRLRLNEANWRLGSASGAAELPEIKTREINLPPDVAPRAPRSSPWRYLIDAKGDSRVFVRGMGLDSEWGADIILRGTTRDPRIGGKAQVVRGSYEFAGTRFDLTRGRIAFDEAVPPDPRLDILAETDVDNLAVRVTVKGSASQPEIAFNSTPALPEEELLARLLFGGSVSDLSATDALQLGTALASLRGGGGIDPINRLRQAIGLDRLRIVSADPAQSQGTAIAAGKNIGRKAYAEIITDGKGYSATQLEYKVTGWLSLLGSVSTLGRESVVVKASKDY